MRLYIKQLLFFGLFLFIFTVVLYQITDKYLNKKLDKKDIFIWGDSQIVYGLDKKILNSKEINYINAAKEGAGIYDMLVFSDKVPNEATVIIGVSKPFFLRNRERDRNDSGLLLDVLGKMHLNDYSYKEILNIVQKNLLPSKFISKETKLYSFKDSIEISKKYLLRFQDIFNQKAHYIANKEKLFIESLMILKKKKCKIILIEFPLHEKLLFFEKKSNYKEIFSRFKQSIMGELNINNADSVKLNSSIRNMHDLTHLNEIGANEVSQSLVNLIKNSAMNHHLLIVNDGKSK